MRMTLAPAAAKASFPKRMLPHFLKIRGASKPLHIYSILTQFKIKVKQCALALIASRGPSQG
jgi:hypothetical protein